jgi:hypothetical protein
LSVLPRHHHPDREREGRYDQLLAVRALWRSLECRPAAGSGKQRFLPAPALKALHNTEFGAATVGSKPIATALRCSSAVRSQRSEEKTDGVYEWNSQAARERQGIRLHRGGGWE